MIYVDNPSLDPYYNFALERYLMKERVLGGEVFLFWRTNPTLMIGNYQNTAAEINEAYAREKGIRIVRRPSGGGTIYTDTGGWQFSFIVQSGEKTIDFRRFAGPIVGALRLLGADARFNDRNDLFIGDKKISGNAQYHSGGAVLHHGSLLFDTDLDELVRSITPADDKLVAKGIKSVRRRVTNIRPHLKKDMTAAEFKDAMIKILVGENGPRAVLAENDKARVKEIAAEFQSWRWNYGRAPRLSFTRGGRFEGGRVDIHLELDKGRVTDCVITGDFFSAVDITVVEKALIGKRFCARELSDTLSGLEKEAGGELIYRVDTGELIGLLSPPD